MFLVSSFDAEVYFLYIYIYIYIFLLGGQFTVRACLINLSFWVLHSYYLAHHQVEGMTSIYWNIYLSPNHKNIKKIAVFTLETDIYTVCFQRCEFERNTHFKYWCLWRRDLKFLSDVITVQPWKVLLRNYPRIQLRVLIWTITPTYMIKWLWGFSVKGLKQSAWLVSSQNFLVVSPFW